MDALRTAVVLVLLLALGYGVWVVLNHDADVEEPPAFDWSTEMADSGAGGFGDGPFVPPADGESEGEGGFEFGTGPANTGANSAAANSSYAEAVSGAAATPQPSFGAAASTGIDEPSIPPPPPGFSNEGPGATETAENDTYPGGSDATPLPPADSGSEPPAASSAYAEPPSPAEAPPSASRYAADLNNSASAPPNGGSVYGSDEAPAPNVTGDSAAMPAKSTPLTPGNDTTLATVVIGDVIRDAKTSIAENEHYEALYALSKEYRNPTATESERREMIGMLDSLAGKVVYSTEHLLEPAHVVRRGEDLVAIAKDLSVPYQLLQNINAVSDPRVLTPGTSLKVVRGPFRAEVDLNGSELTLFLGPLYAGRFPISVGAEPSPTPGEYEVREKEAGKAYFGSNGATFPADHPSNPYGQFWIDLGNQVCIHGTAAAGEQSGMGCVSLSPRDAADVYGILSAGSKVLIRR